MNGLKRVGVFVFLLAFLLLCASGEAQEKKAVAKGGKGTKAEGFGFTSSRAPIDITSDTLEANQKANTVTFKGNVVAKQEDVTLYANTLVITYDQDTKKLKQIEATGNVKVVQLERRATSQKVTFREAENQVVFDGDAVIREGENVIRGERVIYYVDEERSVVEGGGDRVRTRITPPAKEEGQGKKK